MGSQGWTRCRHQRERVRAVRRPASISLPECVLADVRDEMLDRLLRWLHVDTLSLVKDDVRAEYRQQLEMEAAEATDAFGLSPLDRLDSFHVRNRTRRSAGAEQSLDNTGRVFPLHVASAMRAAFSIDPHRRRRGTVHFEVMRRAWPSSPRRRSPTSAGTRTCCGGIPMVTGTRSSPSSTTAARRCAGRGTAWTTTVTWSPHTCSTSRRTPCSTSSTERPLHRCSRGSRPRRSGGDSAARSTHRSRVARRSRASRPVRRAGDRCRIAHRPAPAIDERDDVLSGKSALGASRGATRWGGFAS